jgi:dolichol-phosphate mannosyltransferase
LKLPYNSPHFGRILRFLIGGGSAATLNLALAYFGVEILGFSSELQQNFVNLVAMETSLLYSFFIYRAFVWRDKTSSVSRILLRQIPLYHMSAGAALLSRALLFPVLQALGLYYLANILLGIMAGAALNYFLSNRYVFNNLRGEKSV